MPAIKIEKSLDLGEGDTISIDMSSPAKVVRNEKTGFKSQLIKNEQYEEKVVFSYGIKLTLKQIEDLLPYCNALEFEQYRNKNMSKEELFCVCTDGRDIRFKAMSDSYLPIIELPLDYGYEAVYKLYHYINMTFFKGNKELKQWSF